MVDIDELQVATVNVINAHCSRHNLRHGIDKLRQSCLRQSLQEKASGYVRRSMSQSACPGDHEKGTTDWMLHTIFMLRSQRMNHQVKASMPVFPPLKHIICISNDLCPCNLWQVLMQSWHLDMHVQGMMQFKAQTPLFTVQVATKHASLCVVGVCHNPIRKINIRHLLGA